MDKELRKDARELVPHALRAWMGYTRQMERDLGKIGLNIPQYALLASLQEKGKSSMSAVGRELGVTMGAGTNLTDKLVLSGLAARERDEEDRRAVWVEITDKGREALKSAEGVVTDYLALRMAAIDAEERKSFIAGCRKLASETTTAPEGLSAAP